MRYKGSCHCRAIQFEFSSDEITEGLQCNCSICIRKNIIMSKDYVLPHQFELISGRENLSKYHWGDKDVNHYFCKTCGIAPFHDATYEPGKYRINLGCVANLEPRKLSITEFDGKNLI